MNTKNKFDTRSTDRILWIDMAKGLGVVLVIYGHMLYATNLGVNKLIYAFHVPVFFILSGYVYEFSIASIKENIIKKLID
ncbi:MAG: acyltransferase family protein [Hespellia sp.]|nr:acyltransferase family protein [Hespellia sp.]